MAAYSFHLTSLTFNIGAFFCLILFWSSTIDFGGSFDVVFPIACGMNALNVFGLITVIIVLTLFGKYPLAGYSLGAFALYNAFVLFTGTVWLLVCGIRLQIRLNNYNKTSKNTHTSLTQNRELRRLNMMLSICGICYFARSVFLVAIFMWDTDVGEDKTSNTIC